GLALAGLDSGLFTGAALGRHLHVSVGQGVWLARRGGDGAERVDVQTGQVDREGGDLLGVDAEALPLLTTNRSVLAVGRKRDDVADPGRNVFHRERRGASGHVAATGHGR